MILKGIEDLDLCLKELLLTGYTVKPGRGWCIQSGLYKQRHATIETPSSEFASHRDQLIIRIVDNGSIELEMRFGSNYCAYPTTWWGMDDAINAITQWCRNREP
jgi:hypothetical protein